MSYNCNETENNLNGVIRKDTGHLSGFLSRAMVNSRNIKMMCVCGGGGGGIEVNPPRFFFSQFYQVYFLWDPLHFNSNEYSSFMFETYFI